MSIPLVLASDDRFAVGAGVMIQSVLENTCSPVRFLYLHADLSNENIARIKQIVAGRPDCRLEMVDASQALARLPAPVRSSIYSRLTYARLLAPSLLQEEDRAIYLDCDVLVRDDIRQLFEIDLEGHAFSAMPDYGVARWVKRSPKDKQYFDDLTGGRPAEQYFNAGVLVMDLAEWRRQRITEQTEAVIRSSGHLRYADQCALNVVAEGRFRRLPERWNLFSIHGSAAKDPLLSPQKRQALREAYANPSLVHYICEKPWTPFPMPYKRDFTTVLRRSPWKDYRESITDLPPERRAVLWKSWRRTAVRLRLTSSEVEFSLLGNQLIHWNRAA
ncbi:MAG: glycosyltransferase family 8 protein [Planctomycetales bacterium]|nr:glycosyltransferase family 8 protein [Planctomycetales bacterium]